MKRRYEYIDNMKFAACVLVVIGHFVMSLTANSLMPRSFASEYLIDTMYTFHVPVFFVCSGFLYQKANRVHTFSSRVSNIKRKLLDLGVPYCVFTTITVLLKKLFENDVTSKTNELADTLILNPTAPYWYLYVLMFFFIITPCMKSKKRALLFLAVSTGICFAFAAVYSAGIYPEKLLYGVTHNYPLCAAVRMICFSLRRLIWFALGMYLAFADEGRIKQYAKFIAPTAFAAAIIYSFLSYRYPNGAYRQIPYTIIGILFIVFIIVTAISFTPPRFSRFAFKTADYFMPVYVLHTIFSAGIRIMLLKLNITHLAVHILGGIVGGFVLPVLCYLVCEKVTPLMFFFYPSRTIKRLRNKNGNHQKAL